MNKEAPLNFLIDSYEGILTLRSINVLVHGWIEERNACLKFTMVSLSVGPGTEGFTIGHATLKIALSKVAKHEKSCFDNQHAFISLAFDTFDFLEPEALNLLQKVQRHNIVSHRTISVIFKKINFVIQKI